jgi:hypothetical protein
MLHSSGGVSVNWEHAWGDGHTMMHITQLLLQFARSISPPNPSPMPYTSPSLSPHPHPPILPQHLPFNLSPTLQAAISRSLAAGGDEFCKFIFRKLCVLLNLTAGQETHQNLSLDVLQVHLSATGCIAAVSYSNNR